MAATKPSTTTNEPPAREDPKPPDPGTEPVDPWANATAVSLVRFRPPGLPSGGVVITSLAAGGTFNTGTQSGTVKALQLGSHGLIRAIVNKSTIGPDGSKQLIIVFNDWAFAEQV